MQIWIKKELATADTGDIRLNRRFELVVDRMSQKPSESIPAAFNGFDEVKGAYRFFDNDKISEEVIFKPHIESTVQRISQQKVVLLAQDTTELDVTRIEATMKDAGPLSDEKHLGFYNHPMLSLTPEGIPLGLVNIEIWARDMEEFVENKKLSKEEKKKKIAQTPIEDKESYRWIKGYNQACEIARQVPETTIVTLSDSECDIFEYFLASVQDNEEKKAEWIVRACQNRSLSSKDENGKYDKLWESVSGSPILKTIELKVSKDIPKKSKDNRKRNQPRSARTTEATVQAITVELKAPYRPGVHLSNVSVNAILIKEVEPPEGETPVEWLLLTSLPINTVKEVLLVVEYYCCRWQIEIYFRVLKSGCKVEKLRFEVANRYKPCLAVYMIVAWRVMYCLMLGRKCPEIPCDLVFSDDEWKSVYVIVIKKTPPQKAPSLGEMIHIIPQLGGYLNRKSDGPPGPKTMWIGMQRMYDFAQAWSAARNIE